MHYFDAGILSIPENISDHKATYVILPSQYNLQGSFIRLVWLYKKGLFRSFDIENIKLWLVFLTRRVVRRRLQKMYRHLRHLTSKRDELKRKLIDSTSLHLREQYRKLRYKVNNLTMHAKERFYNNIKSSISDFYSNNKIQFWSIIRHFVMNNSSTSSIQPLKVFPPNDKNNYCFTDMEKAECLNEYFTSVSTLDYTNIYLPAFELKCQN